MGSSTGENVRLTVFGQSHSAAVGMTLEGIPAGEKIDFEEIKRFLSRRAPGRSVGSTARKEPDVPEFLSGFVGDVTCGAPITAIIRNTDARPADYAALSDVPRPGHADFTAHIKYGGAEDRSGGGHFSGRLTAPLCIAGGICLQLLKKAGVTVVSRVLSIGNVSDEGELGQNAPEGDIPTVSAESRLGMRRLIEKAASEGNSVGGVIECWADGLPAGLGDPIFGGVENRISAVVFGIPAVKGIEFGAGFASAKMTGLENNDAFVTENGRTVTATNNCGGILGGITDGMPLVFRIAVKPTPSIAAEQKSVNIRTGEEVALSVGGRHDACIVPRAVPCAEAAAAFAIYDMLQGRKKEI